MGAAVCKVYTTPSSYEGNLVRIRAVYAPTPFEGSYLIDSKCGKVLWFTTPEANNALVAALISNPFPTVAKADFALVKDEEYERFSKFAYATVENLEPEYKVTATFTGRIDRCPDFKLGKDGFGNGFGQMGQSKYQFILQSVSDVTVEEPDDIVVPTRSVLPNHITENTNP